MSTNLRDLGFESNNDNEPSMLQVAENRAMHEVQAAYVIAKKFPRDEKKSYLNIIKACKRPSLAEQALYAYKRGSAIVEGASIRLAETIAQSWGNIDFGIRELSQNDGISIAEAYAIDLETNMRVTKVFHVPHVRYTKTYTANLTDPRDIYELVANNGARRLRACILAVIPGDIIEAAVDECKNTLKTSNVKISTQMKTLTLAFEQFGVTKANLEKRLGHPIERTVPEEIATLRGIYKSIKDGIADKSDFFDSGTPIIKLTAATKEEKLNQLLGMGQGHLTNKGPASDTLEVMEHTKNDTSEPTSNDDDINHELLEIIE
jgi:hypothetical protein